MRKLSLLLLLLVLSACAVETGPPVSPEELSRAQTEIWEIKLREYLHCEDRVGRVLVRILPVTEHDEPHPWFLVKIIDLSRTPPEVDRALSRIFAESLPEKGYLVTFVHPALKRQGLSPGEVIQHLETQRLRLGAPVRLTLADGRLLSLKPPVIYTEPVDFRIVDSPEPNAWVTPENRMYVTLALCRTLPDDHELAAVVGHELAHLKRGHLKKQMTLLTLRDLLGIGVYALGGQTAQDLYRLGANFALLKFSRDQEREADFYGLWYTYRAGYNLEKAAQVWVHLAAVLPPGGPSLLSTHPPTAERLARIRKIVAAIRSGKTFEELRGGN
ncbi:M48 family metallopeptidase [Thermosulfurimonas marina]|uniref:M48 family metallopeptidase n=1 Tax=Thermosulfurimonas marina TaxID=2047767 RepID=A0A6H1WR11_9BACT|nr:M48 family metallopeptidase [Thermosulfurimonas marina]QJA05655.1 M48 family metallopeptidase [Thermosulfurimonas marina]